MLAAGVPVVAEAVGQVTEYVRDGRTGVVCASGDVAGLMGGTVALLAGSERERREAAQADIAKRFGWGQLAGAVEDIYATLLIKH